MTVEQNHALATTPADALLASMLQTDPVKDARHADRSSKRANALRV